MTNPEAIKPDVLEAINCECMSMNCILQVAAIHNPNDLPEYNDQVFITFQFERMSLWQKIKFLRRRSYQKEVITTRKRFKEIADKL